EILQLRERGCPDAARSKLVEMARLHEERAREQLSAAQLDGWIDLFAAITAWGEADCPSEAERLVRDGRQFAAAVGGGRQNIEAELDQHEAWLNGLYDTRYPRDSKCPP